MKNLIAFILACFAVGLAVTLLTGIPAAVERFTFPVLDRERNSNVYIYVSSSQDSAGVVTAIKGLNLPRVSVVQGHKWKMTIWSYIAMPFEVAFYLFFASGFVFVIFKRICRRMQIEPIV